MGPTTYSLCHSPIVGVVMWLSFQCTFPTLVPEREVSLEKAGPILSESFEAPVDKGYPLLLTFTFPSVEARIADTALGDRYAEECRGTVPYDEIPEERRIGLGKPLQFQVIVKDAANAAPVVDRTIVSLCAVSHDGKTKKSRLIGYIPLKRGKYTIDVINLAPQSGLDGIKPSLMLAGGMGKD